jgi:hypothetical protein
MTIRNLSLRSDSYEIISKHITRQTGSFPVCLFSFTDRSAKRNDLFGR